MTNLIRANFSGISLTYLVKAYHDGIISPHGFRRQSRTKAVKLGVRGEETTDYSH